MQVHLNTAVMTMAVSLMLAVGMDLTVDQVVRSWRRRIALFGALAAQVAALPIIGWLVVKGLSLPPSQAAGLLLVAACPIGDIANFYALIARTDLALAVLLNTTSCAIAAVTMPLIFATYGHLLGAAFDFAAPPLLVVFRIVLISFLPIAVGMAARRFAPLVTVRLGAVLKFVSIVLLLVTVGLIIAVQLDRIAIEWMSVAAASLALMAGAAAVGWGLGRIVRLSVTERGTWLLTFPVRNVAIAMTVAVSILGQIEYASFAVIYFLTEVPLLLAITLFLRRR